MVLGFSSSESAFADFVQIVARAKPAVVELDVETEDGFHTGTGFFISPNGYLVTNAHVIAGALSRSDIVATTNDDTHYFVQRIAYVDQDADIAIVKLNCGRVAYLEPDLYDDVAEGQAVLVIGNPEGLQGTVSNGLVAAIRKDQNRIQITAPISPGSSGSPVLNEDGHVIGVAVEIFKEGQNLNFCIPVEEVWKGMAAISGVNSHSRDSRTDLPGKRKRPSDKGGVPQDSRVGIYVPHTEAEYEEMYRPGGEYGGPAKEQAEEPQKPPTIEPRKPIVPPVAENPIKTQQEAERALNAAYQELVSKFDPQAKELLRQEELAWLKQRERFQDDPAMFLKTTVARVYLLQQALIFNGP